MPKREEQTIQKGDYIAHVSPRSVAGYVRHGWTVVDDGSSGSEAPKTPEAEETPQPAETTSRKAE